MIEHKQILLKDLEVDCWYIGRGRRANNGFGGGYGKKIRFVNN